MKIKLVVLTTLLFFCLVSCKDYENEMLCTQNFVYGLSITLADASSPNIIITNATIIAKDGDYEEVLEANSTGDVFFGAGERPGTYVIVVTSTDYETFTSEEITVTEDECHVITQQKEFALQPK